MFGGILKGIVTCSKNAGKENARYYLIDPDAGYSIREFRSLLVFKPAEYIVSEDDCETVHTADISDGTGALELIAADVEKMIAKGSNSKTYKGGVSEIDAVTDRMWSALSRSGKLLLKKLAYAAPIIIRFHNDADGSGGAYGLYASLRDLSGRSGWLNYRHNITWIMNPSVSYGAYEASSDIMIANNYECVEKPLLIIIDFGTSLESNPGIELVKDRFDVIWLDHHPTVEGFKGLDLENYINPWNFGGDSNYTAGLLACTFSKTFSRMDTRDIENASLIGDYSNFSRPGDEGTDISMILDLLTSDMRIAFGSATDNLTPYEIDKVISDSAKRKELADFAKMRLDEVMDIALGSLKRYNAEKATIYVLDFEGIRDEQSKFPLPGRFSSKLLDRIIGMGNGPAIVVVHSGRYVSMRVPRDLEDKVDLIKVVGSVKESHEELIEAGGGHRTASGIKIADAAEKPKVLKEIISLLKAQLAGSA